MKRLAILMCGHFRTWNDTKKTFFENIINTNKDEYKIDIFIYTWNTLGYSTVGTINQNPSELDNLLIDKYGVSKHSLKSPLLNIEQIKKELCPINMIVNDEENMKKEIYDKVNTPKDSCSFYPNVFSNYRNVYYCNKLKIKYETETNFTYDAVLKVRPDILYFKPININNLITNIEHKKIYVNNAYVNDLIFIGTSDTLNISSNIFKELDNTKPMDSHKLFISYLINNNIIIFTVRYYIGLLRHDNTIIEYDNKY